MGCGCIVDAQTGVIAGGCVIVEDMLTRQPGPEPGDRFPVHLVVRHTDAAYGPR